MSRKPSRRVRLYSTRRPSPRRFRSQLSLEPVEPRLLLAGTPQLLEINPSGASEPSHFTPVGDLTFFVATDGTAGRELWVTDGTDQGTRLVLDIRSGSEGSMPRDLFAFEGELYFAANDGVHGEELWKSDGTAAGTVMLRDINPGSGYQYPYGEGPLGSFPRDFTEFDGLLYFSAEDNTFGGELWRTDGTQAGTVRVTDLWPGTGQNPYFGSYPYSSNPQHLTVFEGALYFSADDGETGRELWRSDGTEAGTSLVKDIFPGTYEYDGYGPYPYSSQPTQFTAANGELFFVAFDQSGGAELWKTDGTDAGTVRVHDINPGTANAFTGADSLVNLNGTLFFIANDGSSGIELWRSDGTSAGTQRLRDINPGAADGLKDSVLVNLNGSLMFAANDGTNGVELWRSDGTAGGTLLVNNIAPGSDSSSPQHLSVIDNRLFFSATNAEFGRELWEANDAAAALVADLADGATSSSPMNMAAFGGTVLFSADNGSSGQELWTVDALESATVKLTIYVDGQRVAIPANIGVDDQQQMLSLVRTTDANGTLVFEPLPGMGADELPLSIFFDTWQLVAGTAGNNPNATFSATELMNNDADAENTVQMFVNGQLNTQYEDYVASDGDEIILVYGSNPVVSLNTNFGPIVVELFEEETPLTVANFLNYINDGDYTSTFFHRSDPGFVIQGGGFTTPSTTFTNTSQFTPVPTDPPVTNEPGISNLRGTVAMAKVGGDPNSATSQFFVNLSDDNAALDSPANGSFTVFGQVLDMSTVDAIEDLPVHAAGPSPFDELPYSSNNQLAVIQSIEGFGEITGVRFEDLDGDGVRDTGEDPVAGVRIYVDANDNGTFDTGESFAITDAQGRYRLQAEPGTWQIRSEASASAVTTFPASGVHSVTVAMGEEVDEIDFAENPIPVVGNIDLLPASDSGTSPTDNVTNRNNASSAQTLQFEVSGVTSGAEVRLRSGTTVIGTAVASGSTVTITTNGTVTLEDGLRSLTATQVVGGSESPPSQAFELTIDTTPPAAVTNNPTAFAQIGQAYSFDLASPDEGQQGVTYSLVNAPAGMTINSQTGVITWTPSAAQEGPAAFQVALSDTAGNTSTLDVDVTVLGELPAMPDSYTVNEDTTLTVNAANGVLANDGDETSGTLVAAVVTQPENGTLTLNADGSFTYVPDDDFHGTDTFTYRASEGTTESNIATVTITVTSVNDAPVGVADSYTVNEDTTLTVNSANGVLANDTDVDEDATLTATVATQPTNGTLTLNSNGSFTYVPTNNFNGTDSFTYTVSDGTATSAPVTVSITVSAVNDQPTAVNDTYTVAEDGTLNVAVGSGVLANDTDPESTLTASVGTNPSNGTLTLNANGSFTYTPNANFNGTDTFTYIATDTSGATATGTVTITVTSQPDPPNAVNDTFTVSNTGAAQTLNVLANDTSTPDATQTLSVTAITQGTNGGTVTRSGNTITYRPAAGFTGTDTFTYTITDTDGLTDTATVTVTVTAATANNTLSGFVYIDADNDGTRDTGEMGVPGSLVTLTGTTSGGQSVNQTFITTDTGSYTFTGIAAGTYQLTQTQPEALVDGRDTTSITGATTSNDQFNNIVLTTGQNLANNNFGERSIRPAYVSITWFFASANATTARFRETIAMAEERAGNMELAEAIRNGDTTTGNRSPVAVADTYTTNSGAALTVNAQNGVLANDTDPDNDTLTATLVDGPDNGSLSLNANGSFTYTPTAGFSGTDTFTYTASDGSRTSNTATVTITVTSVQNTFSIPENSPAGTVVGTVVSNTVNTNTPFYQFIDSGVPQQLRLMPDDHLEGNPAAPIVLIEYLDLQCPVCQQFHPIVEDLLDEYGDELLVVRRHLPLTTVHPNAMAAARAAEAAGRQGMFEEMVDRMFEDQDEWENASNPQSFFNTYAQALGLNMTQFAADIADPTLQARIQRDITAANALGVTATPGFFLNGTLVDNEDALDDFEELVDDELDDFDEPFLINRLTGQITVSGAVGLNFESQPTITRQVLVRNLSGATDTVTVTINLTNVNESMPVAVNDTYTVAQGATLNVNATNGVLNNDTDADDDDLTATLVNTTTNGTLTLNSNGSFTYTPNTGFQGTDTFTYRASDGQFTSSTAATVTITVTGAQTAPVAAADSYSLNQDATLTVNATQGVLSNDTDANGDTLSAVLVSNPSNGTLTLNTNGSFTYVPSAGFSGSDSFTYRASDGTLTSAVTTVTLTVNDVNVAPVGVADSYSVAQNGSLTVDATAGVLANDTDNDDDTLTASLVTTVANGTLSLNANGSFTYSPNAGFTGTDTFVYRASDGSLNSANTTVTITVTDENLEPNPMPDNYTVDEDTVLTVAAAQGVLANDTDPDGDTLVALLVTNPSNGTLTFEEDGSFAYVPDDNFSGTDSFTYRVDDGSIDSAAVTVTITVAPVNDAPEAANDAYTVDEDTTLNVNAANGVLSNDTDIDNDDLTAVIVTQPENGTVTLNEDGSFTYEPDENFGGTDSFTYRTNDGSADSEPATVTITVTSVNDAPEAANDTYTVDEDTTLNVNAANGLLSNDTDIEDDDLTAVVVTQPQNGTVTLNEDGSFSYVPDEDFNGTDSFTYRAHDGSADSEPATVTITVLPVNDAPVAVDDMYSSPVDSVLTIDASEGVLSNDNDAEDDSLTVALVDDVAHGTLSLGADGSFTYTPDGDFHGSVTFTYRASDGTEPSNIATVTLQINTMADATDDAYTVDEDSTLVVDSNSGVLQNDTDADGDALTAVLVTPAEHGQLTLNADGSFTYTPDEDFFGTDTFTYAANDGFVDSAAATVTITVAGQPDPPVTAADTYTVAAGQTLEVDAENGVLLNDIDPDGDTLIAQLMTAPTNGTLTLNTDGSFTYVPNAGFHGVDQFTYVADDGTHDSAETAVTIQVNSPATAVDDSYAVNEDETLNVAAEQGVLANDSDEENDTLSAVLGEDVEHGTLILNADGSFQYTPDENFHGTDSFTYVVSDGISNSAPATVVITVASVNDRPVGADDFYQMDEDTTLSLSAELGPLANDTDVDGDTLFLLVVLDPTHGTLQANEDGSIVYTPNANFVGTDTFTYTADDGDLVTSTVLTVTITVNPVNDAPEAVADAYSLDEDGTLTVDAASGILANDMDIEDDDLTAVLVDDVAQGMLQLNADGSFSYTPDENFAGTDSFTYRATDGTDDSEVVTVTITIHPVNDVPEAVADGYSVDEDGTLSVDAASGVLANDTDTENDGLSAVLVDDVAQGTLQLNADGSFSYTPDENFTGTDSFTYRASDGTDESEVVTVSITIHPVNDAPVVQNDSYETDFETGLTVDSQLGVLSNDSDLEDDELQATVVDEPDHGTVSLLPDGSFVYAPDDGFSGTDSFTYRANDGQADSELATVTITVRPANSFVVPASAAAGTLVGMVVPDASLGSSPVYEFEVPALNDLLQLVPDDHWLGDAAAPLVLIEYLDLQCPTCQAFHPLVSDLATEFADELLIVRRHYPLTGPHPNAFPAALSAEAAARQGKFEEMIDLMFVNQDDWENAEDPQSFFDTYAQQLGMDMTQFASDRTDPDIEARVNRDLNAAIALSAPGTPTFYLNGTQLDLSEAFADFDGIIQDALDDFDDPFVIDRVTGDIFVANTSALAALAGDTVELTVNVTDASGALIPATITIEVEPSNAPQAPLSAVYVPPASMQQPQVLVSDASMIHTQEAPAARVPQDWAVATMMRRQAVAPHYSETPDDHDEPSIVAADTAFESVDPWWL